MSGNNQGYTINVTNIDGRVIRLPNVGEKQDLISALPGNPYEQSSTQLFPLGTKMSEGERVWRYAKSAAGSGIGIPQQSAVAINAEQDDDIAIGATSAIGDKTVSVTSTTNLASGVLATANGVAEGYIYFNIAAGLGQCYKIKSHELLATTAESIFTLYDALTIALTTSSKCGIVQNPYTNVLATTAVLTGQCVGVPPLAVTSGYYFWIQTGGPAAVMANTTIAKGDRTVVGTTAAKCDPSANVDTEECIGFAMTPGQSGGADMCMVYLTLDS